MSIKITTYTPLLVFGLTPMTFMMKLTISLLNLLDFWNKTKNRSKKSKKENPVLHSDGSLNFAISIQKLDSNAK